MALNQKINDYSKFDVEIDGLFLMEKRMENDVDGNPIYVGYTRMANEDVDSLAWFIQKIHYDGSGNVERVELPDQGVRFIYAWSQRTTYFS